MQKNITGLHCERSIQILYSISVALHLLYKYIIWMVFAKLLLLHNKVSHTFSSPFKKSSTWRRTDRQVISAVCVIHAKRKKLNLPPEGGTRRRKVDFRSTKIYSLKLWRQLQEQLGRRTPPTLSSATAYVHRTLRPPRKKERERERQQGITR